MSHSHHARTEQTPRYPQPRLQSAAAMSRHVQRAQNSSGDYTLGHGGRQVRIGPVAFWIVVGTLVVMGVWSIATGSYFAFREDVLTRLIGRQADMQFAYEDRIAELRGQVDRITSRQLLDQEQFEKKLNVLLQRQAQLEARTAALSGDSITTGSIRPNRAPVAEAPVTRTPRASPISDKVIFVAPPDREARLESRDVQVATRTADRGTGAGLEGVLSRVSAALDKVESKQTATLTDMEVQVDTKARHIRSVLADLGVDINKAAGGVGGPFIPVKAPSSGASAFERQLYRIHFGRAQIGRYTQTLVTVPVRRPVKGDFDMSSPFGMRMDPFLGRPALHSGLDIRGDTGEPVQATANGRVTTAGREGGYGNLVEIDHGNGLTTRYAHLHTIGVKTGQQVRIGQVIGTIGSTGRSTGPHLHYETRINDEAVNPQRFLRAGLRLGNI